MDTWKKKLKSKHEEERRYEGKNEGKWENDTCVQKTSNYHKNVIFDFFTFGYYFDHSRFTSSVSCKPFSKALNIQNQRQRNSSWQFKSIIKETRCQSRSCPNVLIDG